MRTVLGPVCAPGVHSDARPDTSIERNWTSVWPAAEIVTAAPGCGAVHVVPPSVEVRYWYPDRPLPGESVEPLPVTVSEAAFVQVSDPPATVGAVGALRSIRAVLPASGD